LSSTVLGADAPPISFGQLGLPSDLVDVLRRQGITQPLPIQSAAIVDAIAGRDVSGMAPTGSGKTLAFALPMAAKLSRGTPRRPRGLVLAPTRELAAQIAAELAPLLKTRGLKVHSFYGGVGFGPQRNALRKAVDVAVACPGRLEDLMRSGDILLSDVDMVVVDEADRMADMGFLPAVRRILDAASPRRQTLLFSATLDGDVDVLVRRYQRQPVRHEVAAPAEEFGRVSHQFHSVANADRVAVCAELVADQGSTIVFVRTKHGADRVANQLTRTGVVAQAIHGGRSQSQRDRTLAAFRADKVQALVATDVAARGIHVDDVSCVIHFDVPADAKDYLHRSGRTGRVGAEGSVIALVTPDQQAAAATLRRNLDLDITGPGGEQLRRPAGPAARSKDARGTSGSNGRRRQRVPAGPVGRANGARSTPTGAPKAGAYGRRSRNGSWGGSGRRSAGR
jgi:superfamily II DNA/RNA helicase